MIRSLLKTLSLAVTMSPIFVNQLDAYCSRCVKIEEERAIDRQKNPQPDRYYDDQPLADIGAENSFMMEESNRLDRMKQSNRNKIDEDRQMIQKGYDPNENYSPSKPAESDGINQRSYPDQE